MHNDLEDYFIPSKRNNYAPHGLQKAAMFGMMLLVILSFTLANVQSLVWISSQWMISTILPAVIVEMTNEERQTEALGTLRRNSTLDAAAKLKAEHMARLEYFAHYSPEGVSPWHWFGEAGYNFVHAGENLAIHFTDSGDVVDAWMDSPTHRANIMNGDYAEIGVGTAEGTFEGYATVYVVQLFGTPAAAPVQVAQAEEAPAVAEVAGIETSEDEEVLSESVSLSEEVVIYEAEPEPIVIEEEATTTQASEELAISTVSTTPEEELPVVITDMETTDHGVALYSDFIATSTGGIPATIGPGENIENGNTPFFLELATQPHKVLQILYVIIGLAVLVSLLVSIFIEIRHQQPVQIAYGAGLLAIMGMLYYMHMIISNGALII